MPGILLRISILVAVLGTSLFALDPAKSLTQYAHRIWGHEEGLFQPTVFSIAQTRDGFLWLGTENSLIRFDGAHFRNFERDNKAVFERTPIRDLSVDGQGNLWIASLGGGAAKFAPNGSFTHYTTKNGLPSDAVFCVNSDSGGRTWICTAGGLVRIDRGGLKTFTTADGLPSNKVRSTCEAADGVRWVAGIDFGLARLRGSRFETYADKQIDPREGVAALQCGSDGSVWAATDAGLVQIHDASSRRLTTKDGLPDNAISALAEGPDGSLWIGSHDGITRYRDGDISVYRTQDGLSHSLVQSLYFDREGTLWVGTKDGLDQFTDGDVTPYTTDEGLPSNQAGPVIQDAAGRLWIGTLDRGLAWFDGRRFHDITAREGLLNDTVLSLATGSAGDLWVGTARGLNRLRDGRVVAAYTQRNGLSGPQVRSLTVDAQGTLWAGTNDGLDRFDGVGFHHAQGVAGVENQDVVALGAGLRVRLFASTGTPAFYFLADNRWQSYGIDASHPVDCYYVDSEDHSVWMGTLGSGLLRWSNGALTHIRIKDGLYDDRIYSILSDGHGNLWFASSKGIFRVSERQLDDFAEDKLQEITSIPFSTGQLRFECRAGVQPAASRTRDGRLWFSTTSGVVMIDPKHLGVGMQPPPVAITGIVINGRRLRPSSDLHLKPGEKNVEIQYAGLSFIAPEKVSFQYRLEGYDKAWTNAGTRREAFFTNLPPGDFTFEVLARSAGGVWSRRPAVFSLTIDPHLYQRAWFFPALAVLLTLIVIALYRMRIRQLKSSFDLVLAERTRIARELHDTLLQGLSGVTMQLQALWTRMPVSAEKQTLAAIIGDAGRCCAEARRSLWNLRSDPDDSHAFSGKLSKTVREAVAGSEISLRLQVEPLAFQLVPEVEYQLLRIVREATSNVVRHARASRLTVSAVAAAGRLRITVEDNGVGFVMPAARNRFGHFGLKGMEERAKGIGAVLEIGSSPGGGTKVSLGLPLRGRRGEMRNPKGALAHQ